jgi:hypothetical protein
MADKATISGTSNRTQHAVRHATYVPTLGRPSGSSIASHRVANAIPANAIPATKSFPSQTAKESK